MRFELTRGKFLSHSELSILRHTLKVQADTNPRDVLLIELALHTGARAESELLRLTFQDLTDDGLYITGSKGSKDRIIPLTKNLRAKLYARQEGRPSSDRIFPISYPRLYQIWNEYRPCKKSFHSLRHTAAVLLYERTKDLKLVQTFLGHRWISTTAIYQDYFYNADALRRVLCEE